MALELPKTQYWTIDRQNDGQFVTGLDEIKQSIYIILNTIPGSSPLKPTFGCALWKYIDQPINVALPFIIKSVKDAVNQWEPRATVKSVVPVLDEASNGRVTFRIFWTSNLGDGVTDITK